MSSAFDQRIIRVTLTLLSGSFTFQGLAIFARGSMFASAQQGQCELTLFNMTKDQRNQVLTQASPMNLGRVNSPDGQYVPVNMKLDVGRDSYGTFTLFQGNVIACNVTQPPDIGVMLRGMTSNYLASVLAGLNQPAVTLLSTVVRGVAASLKIPFEFTATDRQVDNYSFSGGVLNQVQKLNLIGGILAYIDPKSNTLIVHDSDKSRPGGSILVSANTGMVGIPQVTEVGVIVRVMLAPSYRLGGQIEVVSEINPAANGAYFIYAINFDVTNRDTPFWLTLNCRTLAYYMGDIVSNAPSRNPAGNDTLSGLLNFALLKFLQNTDGCLPARVLAYDPATNRARVQPLIAQVTTGNQHVARAQVASVPVARWGAGGIAIRFPVQAGDPGWLIASDRDISLYKQTGAASAPNTNRLHSFEDGWFLPDTAIASVTLAAEDSDNAVWQDFAGTVRLSLWPDKFKFTAPQVAIGDTDGYSPNPHAVLDVQSTTRAFLPPRMSTAQKLAIPSPEEGMVVWDLTAHALSTYNGSAWS